MNRNLFANLNFTTTTVPSIPCPSCHEGRLVHAKGFVRENDNAWTQCSRKEEEWESEWTQTHFSAVLLCNNSICKEAVHMVGVSSVEEVNIEIDDHHGPMGQLDTVFTPMYFVPPLRIFDCPNTTPDAVRQQVLASFAVFFSDASSAANRVRSAVEFLLTSLKVPKKEKIRGGKFKSLTLHRRIERLGVKYSNIKELLLAVKWIGNTGSHATEISRVAVMDAYDMLEHCLDLLYGEKKDLMTLAKAINRKKGPLKPRPHRKSRLSRKSTP
jgi:hypothetical protein